MSRSFGGRGAEISYKEVDISAGEGSVRFKIGTLASGEALKLLHAIKLSVGPVLLEALKGKQGDIDSVLDIEGESLGKAIKSLFEGVFSEALVKQTFTMLTAVSFAISDEGDECALKNPVILEEVFRGRHKLYYQFIFEGLKHNYSDFLEGWESMQSTVRAALKKAKPSPTGLSGGITES